jgi:hypothetical protein
VDRHADDEIAESERDQRVPPAELIDEDLRQRDEDGAGEAADQRQRRDLGAVAVRKTARQDGEGGLVERCRH